MSTRLWMESLRSQNVLILDRRVVAPETLVFLSYKGRLFYYRHLFIRPGALIRVR